MLIMGQLTRLSLLGKAGEEQGLQGHDGQPTGRLGARMEGSKATVFLIIGYICFSPKREDAAQLPLPGEIKKFSHFYYWEKQQGTRAKDVKTQE